MKSALFIVDCLRYDCFPGWFLKKHKGSFNKFETACNTPLSLNSILMGRNMRGEVAFTIQNMVALYFNQPIGISLFQKLAIQHVTCYLYSNEPTVRGSWWKRYATTTQNPETNSFNNPYFLLYHTYKAHAPPKQEDIEGFPLDVRRKRFETYCEIVDEEFHRIDNLLAMLKPTRFAVMGDHGEEFNLHVEGIAHCGHGNFKKPLLSDNVKYTGLLVNAECYKNVSNYESLHNMILSWYE